MAVDDIRGVVHRASALRVRSFLPLGGGRNSRVFRLDCGEAGLVVAKQYVRRDGTSPRQERESRALSFLGRHGVGAVPELLGSYPEHGLLLMSHVPGQRAMDRQPTGADGRAAAAFLVELRRVSHQPDAQTLGPASEAGFSLEEVIATVARRLEQLSSAPAPPPAREQRLHESFQLFVDRHLTPTLDEQSKAAREALKVQGRDPDGVLASSERTLSPSDFGLHNALRQRDGALVFVDFEHFGWDDPAKMICDFLLHPGMELSAQVATAFVESLLERWPDARRLRTVLPCYYPILALKWCTILLNEFTPSDYARRAFAGADPPSREDVLEAQLDKARRMWDRARAPLPPALR